MKSNRRKSQFAIETNMMNTRVSLGSVTAMVAVFFLIACSGLKKSTRGFSLTDYLGKRIDYAYLQCENQIYLDRDISNLLFHSKLNGNKSDTVLSTDLDTKSITIRPTRQVFRLSVIDRKTKEILEVINLKVRRTPSPGYYLSSQNKKLETTEKNYVKSGLPIGLNIKVHPSFLSLAPNGARYEPGHLLWTLKNSVGKPDTIKLHYFEDCFQFELPEYLSDSIEGNLIFSGLYRRNYKNQIDKVSELYSYSICVVK